MKKRFLQKLVYMILLISILLSQCLTLITSAHSDLKSAYLSKIGEASHHLRFRTSTKNTYVTCSIVGHYIGSTFYPAYCVNSNLPGAETSPYTVTINEAYNNPAVWRVLINGYPYQTPESMGLSMYDAFCVTKMAVFCVIGQSNINGFNCDPNDAVGVKMLAKLRELVNIGLHGTDTMQTNTLSYNKIGEFTESGEHYYQEYSVSSKVDIANYTIRNTVGFPNGTYIGNTSGNAQTTFSNGEHFRVYIPISSITSNINGKVFVMAKTKTYPILYGESRNAGLQNYVITSDPFGDENIEISLNAEIKNGRIVVNKTDKDTGERIAGVVFGLYKDGVEVSRETTDINGQASFDRLMPGNYTITEISSLDNYVLDSQDFGVDVKFGETSTIDLTNEKKKGQIEVIKVDQDYNEIKIEGVTFKIYDEAGREVDTLITDKDGKAISKRLPIDQTYTLKEVSTNNQYIFSENEQKIILEQDKVKEITITNKHKEGNLKIYKVDKDNKKIALGGVEFELFSNEFNKVIGKYVTDSDGEISIENLRIGEYKLHEVKTNKWYNLADDKQISINWNETTNTTVENEKQKGQVKVIKVDKDNNEIKLEGVKFKVLDEKGNTLEEIITNSNGEAMTNSYSIRDFEKISLQEIETLENYKLNSEIKTVTLEANQIKTITFENEEKKGKIKVIKVDKDNNKIKIKGVTFDVLDETGKVIDTIVTDEKGEAITKELPIKHKYTLKETKTLDNYVLTEEIKEIILKEDEIKEITVENEKKKGQIEVIKIDGDNNEVKLEGVTFEVYDENNNLVDTLVTNKEGKAISKRLPIDNKYKVKETITNKFYVLSDEEQVVELKENQITSITFENFKQKGQIKIIKVDKDNNKVKLSNVTFEVYDEDNNLVETLITDENGEAITKELPIDKKYTLKETITNNDYVLSDEVEEIILKENEIKEIVFENEKKKGQIEVIKVDSENNEVKLEGVTFEVYDENNNLVDTLVTDKEGKAISKRLPIDDEYTIREKETRKEYILTEKTEKVILEENEIKTLTFENDIKKGNIKIIKVSSNYGVGLKGAKFAVVDSEGKELGIYETNEKGTIEIENVYYGKYTIYEVEAPKGYLLDSEPKTAIIEDNGQIVELEFEDSPEIKELPKTGIDNDIIVFFLPIIIVSIISIIAVILNKKYRKMEEK